MDEVVREALERWFGTDLEILIRQLGGEIASAHELTRLVSTRQRKASFKLTLRDGRVFKARRLKTLERFNSHTELAPLIESLPFSRIVAARGLVTIEEWTEGCPLDAREVTGRQAFSAGDLLGRLHTITVLPSFRLAGVPDIRRYTNRIDTYLAALVEKEALDIRIAKKIATLAARTQPDTTDVGLIHGDFCADNIVVRENGDLVVVDNESLRLAALDFDLTRCWTRWPMTGEVRQAFVDGYQHHRSLEAVNTHRIFWDISALTLTAYAQTNHNRPCQPILDALARLGCGDGPPPG